MSTTNIQAEQFACRRELADYEKKCAVIHQQNSLLAQGEITPEQYEDVVESLQDCGTEYDGLLRDLYE